MTSKELPVLDPHRQAVPGPQSKGGQDASWAWSSDSDEGGATLPTSRGRSRTLTRSGSPLSTSPSQACSQSHSPGRGHGIGMGIFWHVEHDGLQVVIVIISSCSPARQSSRFHICCTSKRPTRPWEPQREYMRRRHRKPGEMLLLLFQTHIYKKCYKVYLQRNIIQNPMLTWHRMAEVKEPSSVEVASLQRAHPQSKYLLV